MTRESQEATAAAIGGAVASSEFEKMIHDAIMEIEEKDENEGK